MRNPTFSSEILCFSKTVFWNCTYWLDLQIRGTSGNLIYVMQFLTENHKSSKSEPSPRVSILSDVKISFLAWIKPFQELMRNPSKFVVINSLGFPLRIQQIPSAQNHSIYQRVFQYFCMLRYECFSRIWGGFPGEPFVVLGNLWANASKLL